MIAGRRTDTKLNPYRWMTTYTDLVTLLLTFFVLLISMSVVSKERKMAALNSVTGAFGSNLGGHSVIGTPKGGNTTVRTAPLISEEMDHEKLMNVTSRNSLLQSDMSVIKEEERIIISLSNRLLFRPRSSRIEPDRIPFLTELREVLKESLSRIELRGYADPGETVLERDRFRPAAILSTKRAFAVFHFLAEEGQIPPERIVAHGFGNVPAAPESEKDAHLQNRQVQIILDYREKLPFRMTKSSRNNSFLDFKGFIFRIPGGEGEK